MWRTSHIAGGELLERLGRESPHRAQSNGPGDRGVRDVSVWWIQFFGFETFEACYIVASRRFLAACWLLFAGALTIVATSRTARSRAGFFVLLALMLCTNVANIEVAHAAQKGAALEVRVEVIRPCTIDSRSVGARVSSALNADELQFSLAEGCSPSAARLSLSRPMTAQQIEPQRGTEDQVAYRVLSIQF